MSDKASVGDQEIENTLKEMNAELEVWVERLTDVDLPLDWRKQSAYKVVDQAEKIKKFLNKNAV